MDRNRILELAADMTLEEKAMQMTQLSPDMLYHLSPSNLTGPLREWKFDDKQLWETGSVLGPSGAAYLRKLQEDYLKTSRQKIPL
ncbi:MAG: beta-glucosidase, partial [Acetatifactor sp.]|nr:beta-glucosidase [Acetatifactor sp.]